MTEDRQFLYAEKIRGIEWMLVSYYLQFTATAAVYYYYFTMLNHNLITFQSDNFFNYTYLYFRKEIRKSMICWTALHAKKS